MLRHRTAMPCLAALAIVGLMPFQTHAEPDVEKVGWTQPLAELGIGGGLEFLPYPRNYTVHQVSSYDRTGGAADDAYAIQTYEGGRVLADIAGPGAILRIFGANPSGSILFFVDDMEHPIMGRQFAGLFTSELELGSQSSSLFAPPFAGASSGGFYSYVPVPFEERCRIIVMDDSESLEYHVQYAKFPEGTPIKSFELNLTKEDIKYFRDWFDDWTDYDLKRHDLKTEELHQSSTILFPDTNWLVYPIEGPGVITEIEMEINSTEPNYTDKFWIAIYFDHQEEPGVLAPIGDFFGRSSTTSENFSGAALGMIDGRMWCRFPMPFRELAEIRLINTCGQLADFKYNIIWREEPVNNQQYFFARYHSATTVQGQPYRVADIAGAGHFAGTTFGAHGAADLAFLDGDDLIRVDGRPTEDFHGTSTDAFFNSGGYFAAGTYAAPSHACTVKIGSIPTRIGATRSMITDVIPFNGSFSFALEHGNRNDRPGVQYESVAYWYQPNKDAPVWPMPELAKAKGYPR